MKKGIKKVSYQTGVNIVGLPIYVTHIIEVRGKKHKQWEQRRR